MSSFHATQLYFGPPERPLFGWIHPGRTERSIGAILCNPLGYEAVCSHRTLRHLARELAEISIATLRFDYDGTGDSAGTEDDPHRVTAWVQSIQSAIDTLKAVTGVERVVVIGVRAGAWLALEAIKHRSDVAGLAMVAPGASPKAYLRELRVLRSSMGKSLPTDDETLEVAGFPLSAETRRDLAKIGPTGDSSWPKCRMLIVERDDFPTNAALATTLRDRGVEVETARLPGYVGMMSDPHETVVPQEILNFTTSWVARIPSHERQQSSPREAPLATAVFQVGGGQTKIAVEEQSVRLGESGESFGVLTEPVDEDHIDRAVLLLNSGAVHHIGPNRLYVELARRWASRGIAVLRLDLSGLGDSDVRSGHAENSVYSTSASDDVVAAIKFLEQRGTAVQAMGLCSGAYHSLKAALRSNLTRVTLINPLTFFWHEGLSLTYPQHRVTDDAARYRRNAFDLNSWAKLIRGRVNVVGVARVLLRSISLSIHRYWRDFARSVGVPLHQDLGSELISIAKGGTEIDFVFADSDPGQSLLRLNAGRSVPRLEAEGKLRIVVIPDADHTFIDEPARNQLITVLDGFINSAAPERKVSS